MPSTTSKSTPRAAGLGRFRRALASFGQRALRRVKRLRPALQRIKSLGPALQRIKRLGPALQRIKSLRARSKALLAALALAGLLGLLAAGYAQHRLMAPLSQGGVFVVPRGEAEYGTALRLAAEGRLPLSPWLLRLGLGLTALAGDIQLGEYSIPSGLSAYQVLFMLRRGKVKQHSLTFPEGWRLADWLAQLEAHPALVQDTAGLSEAALARRLGMHASLEGWLFPDTYWFAKGDSALGLLHRAHARMQQRLAQLWRADLALAGLGSPYELLILASIIEKETGRPEDQELVASVFHNRLALAMKLQSDPTVIYALGEQFDGNLTRSHLQLDHPYNTYARAGLPPTPICMPGLGALQAAASPASTGYLYFVAKGNGKSYFSVTLEEHNRAVARYQLKQGR